MKRINYLYISHLIFIIASLLFFIYLILNYRPYESIMIMIFYAALIFIPVSLILHAFITNNE
ncbi:hypothetical protein DOE63_14360 [Salmonella enterica subsp. diarizonae serovar 59:z10:-]|nr:hypothetical protein DOE63_14360 [Salmonella enterica subsp. diarizonae serovar 59:z10:-]